MEELVVKLSIETTDAETGRSGLAFPIKTSEAYWEIRRKYKDDKSTDLYLVLTNPASGKVVDSIIL